MSNFIKNFKKIVFGDDDFKYKKISIDRSVKIYNETKLLGTFPNSLTAIKIIDRLIERYPKLDKKRDRLILMNNAGVLYPNKINIPSGKYTLMSHNNF